jgi:hypothetical protein
MICKSTVIVCVCCRRGKVCCQIHLHQAECTSLIGYKEARLIWSDDTAEHGKHGREVFTWKRDKDEVRWSCSVVSPAMNSLSKLPPSHPAGKHRMLLSWWTHHPSSRLQASSHSHPSARDQGRGSISRARSSTRQHQRRKTSGGKGARGSRGAATPAGEKERAGEEPATAPAEETDTAGECC